MKILDNINHTVREDLQDTMQKGSRVSIAAACFSIYAYQELKKQLEEIAELRFIFTSPTFVQENTPKERREFYVPKLTREKSLYGTEFEVRLRNELTQKALAKECADWVRRKVKFRSNVSGEQMPGFMTVGESSYMPISGFTTVDLGCERGNNAYYPVQRTEAFENGRYFLSLFDEIWNDSSRLQDVTDIVLQSISTAYRENSLDFIYFFTLYNIFSEFLEDVSEDNLPNEATGFKQSKIWNMLYDFQRDAALAIIHKLAVSTLNLTAGELATEIEIFELCLTGPKRDEAVLRQIDSEIPYHILFVLSYENKVQAWIGCKDTSANSSAKVSRYLHTDWMPETELSLAISGLSLDAVYDGLVRQIARLQGENWNAAYSIAENIQRSAKREKLQKQIAALENKIRKEKQFNRQVEMNAELKQLKKNLEQLTKKEL